MAYQSKDDSLQSCLLREYCYWMHKSLCSQHKSPPELPSLPRRPRDVWCAGLRQWERHPTLQVPHGASKGQKTWCDLWKCPGKISISAQKWTDSRLKQGYRGVKTHNFIWCKNRPHHGIFYVGSIKRSPKIQWFLISWKKIQVFSAVSTASEMVLTFDIFLGDSTSLWKATWYT